MTKKMNWEALEMARRAERARKQRNIEKSEVSKKEQEQLLPIITNVDLFGYTHVVGKKERLYEFSRKIKNLNSLTPFARPSGQSIH